MEDLEVLEDVFLAGFRCYLLCRQSCFGNTFLLAAV